MAEEAGFIEIVARRQGGGGATLFSSHSGAISNAAKAPSYDKLKLRADPKEIAGPGSKIDLIFTSDAIDIVESEESSLELPILRNGNPGMLTLEDFEGFKPSTTNDVDYIALNQRLTLGTHTVPAGDYIQLSPHVPVHCFIGDDT